MTQPTLPNLDGLIGLARQDGVDIRPTLVRVLTDLYVQKPAHTPAEEHRYTELALWLLSGVDVATRAAVARKLAAYPYAPRLVMRRLARDVFEVAEPALRHASCLTSEDLLGVIKDFGPRHASAIGMRTGSPAPAANDPGPSSDDGPSPPATSAEGSATTGETALEEPAEPAQSPPSLDVDPPTASCAAGAAGIATLGEQFLKAGSSDRRLLLASLEDENLAPARLAFPVCSEDAARQLEGAALQRRPDEFARAIEHMLKISAATARQIVDDELGEPVAVIAKALAIPADILVRILLFLNPRVGRSVERVFGLVDLHEQMSLEAAFHLVASWQEAHSHKGTAEYRPLHFDDERFAARRAGAAYARRPMVQIPDGRELRERAANTK